MDPGKGGGIGHRGLVHDDQITVAESPGGVVAAAAPGGEAVLSGEPAGDVARDQTLVGEDLGGDLAGGQPEHPPRCLLAGYGVGLPGAGDGADDE